MLEKQLQEKQIKEEEEKEILLKQIETKKHNVNAEVQKIEEKLLLTNNKSSDNAKQVDVTVSDIQQEDEMAEIWKRLNSKSNEENSNNELENNVYAFTFEDLPFGNYAAITITYWPSGYSSGGMYTLLGSYPTPLISPIQTYINLSEDDPEMIIDDIEATF